MARANRHYMAGYIWHITPRCHRKQFLLEKEAALSYNVQ